MAANEHHEDGIVFVSTVPKLVLEAVFGQISKFATVPLTVLSEVGDNRDRGGISNRYGGSPSRIREGV